MEMEMYSLHASCDWLEEEDTFQLAYCEDGIELMREVERMMFWLGRSEGTTWTVIEE